MSQTAQKYRPRSVSQAANKRRREDLETFTGVVIDTFGQKGPPFFTPTGPFRRDTGPHQAIHLAYNRVAFAHARTPGYRLRFWLKTLAYPLVWLVRTLRVLWMHGAETRRRSGKGSLTQFGEMAALAYSHSIPPDAYYLFRLFLEEPRRLAGQYVHRFETKNELGLFELLNKNLGDISAQYLLFNKEAFAQRCRERNLPTPEVYLELEKGEVIPRDWDQPGLPAVDLIIKPREGKGGHVMMRWEVQEDGTYVADTGEKRDAQALLELLKRESNKVQLLVVRRAVNHPDIRCFAGPEEKILTTCRLVTARNEADEPEVVSSTFKIAVRQTVADNVHFGGLASPVDVHTGTLGPGIDTAPLGTPTDIHPVSGAAITGAKLPMWDQVIDLVKRAQDAFPEAIFIGWDVGLTPDGPILIEGNHGTCVHLQQTPQGAPLGAGRFGEIMAYHLDRIDRSSFGPVPGR